MWWNQRLTFLLQKACCALKVARVAQLVVLWKRERENKEDCPLGTAMESVHRLDWRKNQHERSKNGVALFS
jgi:hypothetical protein